MKTFPYRKLTTAARAAAAPTGVGGEAADLTAATEGPHLQPVLTAAVIYTADAMGARVRAAGQHVARALVTCKGEGVRHSGGEGGGESVALDVSFGDLFTWLEVKTGVSVWALSVWLFFPSVCHFYLVVRTRVCVCVCAGAH